MQTIIFKGLQIHYEYLPALNVSKGNLLFLHTIGLTLEESDSLIPYFHQDYNILRYDLMGHGKSERSDEFLSLNLLLNQLEFISDYFFKQPFYIIANPASGYIATRFCSMYSVRVTGLILISPPPTYLPLQERENIVSQMKQRASISFDTYKQFMLANLTVKQDSSSISTLKTQFDQTTERTYFEFMNAYLTEDFSQDFNQLHTPILILAGAQDTLFPTSIHGVTANFMGAQFSVISDASTLVAFDNPIHTAATINSFIDKNTNGTGIVKGFILNQMLIRSSLHKGFNENEPTPVLNVQLIYTFRVQIGDIEITKGWNHRRIKSLFLYLLLYKTASREELIDLFWPELEINKARNQLRVNLNHLKTMLNQVENINFIHADREYVFLQGNIKCDAAEYVKELRETYMQSDPEIRLHMAQRILDISPQKLLIQLYDDWFLNLREEIETKYVELCKWVANRLQLLEQFEEALKYNKKVVRLSVIHDDESD